MAQKLIMQLEARTDQAEKNIETVNKEVKLLEKNVGKTEKAFDGLEKATKDTAKGIKKIGASMKAIGIGLIIAAFAMLKDVFKENQKVADAFNTTFNFVSTAFNDFFNFLFNNVGAVIGFFKSIFDDPQESVRKLGIAIKNQLIERFNSMLDLAGHLGQAFIKFWKRDFKGALEEVNNAQKEFVDVLTGVDNTVEKVRESFVNVTKGIIDYTKSTYEFATAQTKANKEADIAVARNRVILEQKDREAELLRQIRDDDLLTIDQRIEANNKLGEVLKEQEKLMIANADALIRAAQLQVNKNDSDANQIALLEAKAEKEAVLAQVTGFMSEQLANHNSLLRENLDIEREVADAKTAIAEAQMDTAMRGFGLIAKMAGKNRALQAAAIIGENAAGIAKQIISTRAANAAVTMKYAPIPAPAGPAMAAAEKILNKISLGLGIASSVFATSQALKALKAGGSPSSPSAGIETVEAQAPAFNIVGQSTSNQLADVLAGQQPIQAYVVSNDVTTAQELDRNIITGASIG